MSEPPRPTAKSTLKKRRKRVTKIYVCNKGRKLGPFSRQEIARELVGGALKLSDLAWYSRLTQWVPLDQLPSRTDDGPLHPMPALPPGVAEEPKNEERPGKRGKTDSAKTPKKEEAKGWSARLLRLLGK